MLGLGLSRGWVNYGILAFSYNEEIASEECK